MAEMERTSALVGHYREGTFGAAAHDASGVTLKEIRPVAIAQVNGAPPEESLQSLLGGDALVERNRVASLGGFDLLWNGPGKWLAVSSTQLPAEFLKRLRRIFDGTDATVTDLSHARTVIRVNGGHACDVLSKGCPADLEALCTGDSIATLMGTLSSVVHCRETGEEMDVYVFRSFGQSFWEWITDASLEFGYEALV